MLVTFKYIQIIVYSQTIIYNSTINLQCIHFSKNICKVRVNTVLPTQLLKFTQHLPFLCLDDTTTPALAAVTVVVAVIQVAVVVVVKAVVLLVPDKSKIFLSTSGGVIRLLVDFLS